MKFIEQNVSCETLIDKIVDISNADYTDNVVEMNEKEEDKSIKDVVTTLIGVVVGAVLTYLLGTYQQSKQDKKRLAHAASILYYDLLSIEDYLINEKDNVNLRYTDDWQDIVACCICLTHQQIEYIYKIYDKTYNYNYYYRKMEKNNGIVSKKDNPYYNEIKNLLFDKPKSSTQLFPHTEKYQEILNILENKAKSEVQP